MSLDMTPEDPRARFEWCVESLRTLVVREDRGKWHYLCSDIAGYSRLSLKRRAQDCRRPLELPDHVHKEAMAAIAHIRELIRVIGKIVAGTDFHVVARSEEHT